MPPPRTGSVEPFKRADGRTYYRARIRLGDGSRERVDVPEKYTTPAGGKTGKERAELYALAVQEREDETGELLAKKRARQAQGNEESADKWHERYLAHCSERGLSTVGDKRYRWGKWISPKIGHKPMPKVSREDIEDIRNALDDAIRDGRLSWKTAANVWGELSVSFGEATNSKRRELRALSTDPTIGVQPPETGGDKSKGAGKGLVVPVLSQTNPDEIAELTRKHFELAECKRPRLYARGPAERRVQFRSWRDAGITWSIVRGDGIERVQRRAGHKLIATTQRYIIEAENRGVTFGEPFPPLPSSLVGQTNRSPSGGTNSSGQGSGQVGRRSAKASNIIA